MLLSGLAHATPIWKMVALTRTFGLYLQALSVTRFRCYYLRRPLKFPRDSFYAQCRWLCYVLWLRFFSVTPLSKEIYINKVRLVGCSMFLWTVHEHVVFGLGRSCACAWLVQVDNSATSLFSGFYSRSTEGTFFVVFFSRACIDEVRCVECRLLLKLQQTKHWWNAKHEVSRRGRSSLSFSRVCNEMRSVKCLPSTEANFLVLFHQSMHWASAKCEIHASADHASVKCNLWSINWQRGGTSVFLLQHRMHWWSHEAS